MNITLKEIDFERAADKFLWAMAIAGNEDAVDALADDFFNNGSTIRIKTSRSNSGSEYDVGTQEMCYLLGEKKLWLKIVEKFKENSMHDGVNRSDVQNIARRAIRQEDIYTIRLLLRLNDQEINDPDAVEQSIICRNEIDKGMREVINANSLSLNQRGDNVSGYDDIIKIRDNLMNLFEQINSNDENLLQLAKSKPCFYEIQEAIDNFRSSVIPHIATFGLEVDKSTHNKWLDANGCMAKSGAKWSDPLRNFFAAHHKGSEEIRYQVDNAKRFLGAASMSMQVFWANVEGLFYAEKVRMMMQCHLASESEFESYRINLILGKEIQGNYKAAENIDGDIAKAFCEAVLIIRNAYAKNRISDNTIMDYEPMKFLMQCIEDVPASTVMEKMSKLSEQTDYGGYSLAASDNVAFMEKLMLQRETPVKPTGIVVAL